MSYAKSHNHTSLARRLRRPWSIGFVAFLLVILVFSAFSVGAAPSPTGATITSDLADYPPGATVTLTGAGWAPGEAVRIVVNDTIGQSWQRDVTVTATESGDVTDVFQLPTYFVSNYDVTATGPTSGAATTTFTDLSVGTYDQCSNDLGTGYSSGDTGCRWINGNLQSNNSRYFEGDATVQRLWLKDFVPGSTHTVTLKYGTTKGGKHAYDFLTRWDWSESWITDADRCQGIAGCDTASENSTAIPVDPNAGGFDVAASLVKPRQFVMRGGTLNSATTPTIVSGSYSGDSETVVTVSFTVANSGPMCASGSCDIALWFGAHVAAQANWGIGLGAGSISGSPYHVALDAVDGASVGQRDNQMQANVITEVPNGTIVIVKDAVPNNAQDFSFSLNNSTNTINQNFSLDDDSDATLPNSQTFSVPPGTWAASELNIPSGWSLTNLVCVDPTNNTTVSLAGAKATINLASNETVTCTFTNTKEPDKLDLTVSKTAMPAFTRTYKWGIAKIVDKPTANIPAGGSATFNYTVDVTHDGGTDSGWTVSGKITVSNPNGFQVSGVSVTDAIEASASCTVTGGSSAIAANSSAIYDYTCVYSQAPAASSQTNTATAIWSAFGSPSTSASGTAAVNWGATTPTIKDGSVTVNDTLGGTLGTVTYTDASPKSFTYSKVFDGVAGTCTNYPNTASFETNTTKTAGSASKSIKVCVGKDLLVTKNVLATFTHTYKWQIDKSVDQTTINIAEGGQATFSYSVKVSPAGTEDSGWAMSGQISVQNPNDWEAITANIADTVDVGGGAACTVAGGTSAVIPAGGSATFNYTCNFTSQPNYTGINTATATWNATTYSTPTGSGSGTASVNFTSNNEINKTITVVDDKTDPAHPLNLGTWDWDSGEHTFTYTLTKSGVAGTCTRYTNTATIDETGQKDSQTVSVCVGKNLTVSKTAAGTFDRAYLWKISKDADKTLVKIAAGGSYTFEYTVVAEQTGISDSGWALSGKITISNPNDWQDITLTGLTDAVDNGGVCTVDPGPYVVPASGSLAVNYSCSYASEPSDLSGTNTATAAWDKTAAATPAGTAAGMAQFTISQAKATNKTVHVTDSNAGALGTVIAVDTSPFTKQTFTYTRTESGVSGKCTDYDNTATITETGQSASQAVTVCVGADLTVEKTATATLDRTYKWKIDKSVDDTRIEIAQGGTATFNYTVKVSPDGYTDSGWTLGGTITVGNPNNWQDVTLDGMTDTLDQGGTCTIAEASPYVVAKGGSLTLHYTCSTGGAATKNTATASWNQAAYATPTGSASGTAAVSFTVDQEINKTITVVDDKTDPSNPVTLGQANWADGTATFTYSLDQAGVAGTCKSYTNTATIDETGQSDSQTVTVCVGVDLTVSKTATPSFTRTYGWGISKAADQTRAEIAAGGTALFNYTVGVTHDAGTDSGWTVAGKITVVNPNDWQAITADVTDAVDNGGACTVTGGSQVIVPNSGSVDLNYTCTWASAPTAVSGTNTATASWDKAAYATPSDTATGTASYAFNTPTTIVNGSVTVTDALADPSTLGTVSYAEPSPKSFRYALSFSGFGGTCINYVNTAKLTETGQSASQTVTVCVGKDLTVSKTATPTFTRTYNWSIAKSVDKTKVTQSGGTATFNYTVLVNQTGFTDSAWKVIGKITVTNPNDWEAIVANVTDALDTGACSVAGGTSVSIPAGKSVVLDYTCDPASASATKNTATATWDQGAAHTPSGMANGTANVAFTTPATTVNKMVTVKDTFNSGTPTTLGTVTATDATPFATRTFTYSQSVSIQSNKCVVYGNTATIVETGQNASASVTACSTLTGGLTIGFWQNKNGQAKITGSASTGGVCNLTGYLRQYAPFQDLSATASCSTVATYVTNVIKAANASGASMNAMLKAQMLATALDVQFNGIGGVKIDLTQICKMVDNSSTGAATCQAGSARNVSAAFGGTTSMTISQMLTYAAGQSNVGGSIWYGQVKATQELAKDAFDAINNNTALIAP
jgi:hypothetical protein